MWASIWKMIAAWFVKSAWPEIQELLITVLIQFLEWLFKKLQKIWGNWYEHNINKYVQKAEEAEKRAQESKDDKEAEKYEQVAKVWREVAMDFLRENESLSKKLADLMEKSGTVVAEKVSSLRAANVFDTTRELKLMHQENFLTLPPPDELEEVK